LLLAVLCSAHVVSGLKARCRDWTVDWTTHGGKKAPAQAAPASSGYNSKGALNSDPLVRLACCFVQCTSREWTESALSRLGRRLDHSRGQESVSTSSASKQRQQAASKQRIQQTAAKAL
jgi:hypothetical protein